jgi:hypothetical protein
MAILHTKKVWKKPPTPRVVDRVNQLTREEEANVLEAMRVVRMQRGSWDPMARSMRMTSRTRWRRCSACSPS